MDLWCMIFFFLSVLMLQEINACVLPLHCRHKWNILSKFLPSTNKTSGKIMTWTGLLSVLTTSFTLSVGFTLGHCDSASNPNCSNIKTDWLHRELVQFGPKGSVLVNKFPGRGLHLIWWETAIAKLYWSTGEISWKYCKLTREPYKCMRLTDTHTHTHTHTHFVNYALKIYLINATIINSEANKH